MLPSPRIVVIDDEEKDVLAIVEALNLLETSAVGIHYSPERELPVFPCLRILFLDLHLMPGAGSTEQQAKHTVDLLPRIMTSANGPYAIVLWSGHATEREIFEGILGERLPALEITAPLKIVSLDKIDHLQEHEVRDPRGLREAVLERIRENPQLAALLAWEEHVAQAVNDTICKIFHMARRKSLEDTEDLSRILGELAIAGGGHENAMNNVFRATNEVLVQIVSDRLLHRTETGDLCELWRKAVAIHESRDSTLSSQESVRLNQLLHLEEGAFEPWRRGSVVNLTALSDKQFADIWGEKREDLLKAFDRSQKGIVPSSWAMVQVRPACDEAQQNNGLLPFLLGIEIVKEGEREEKWAKETGREYLWMSPPLPAEHERSMHLALHLRFVAGLTREKVKRLKLTSQYRLRESILEEISHRLHSYSDRPGIISFRSSNKNKKK